MNGVGRSGRVEGRTWKGKQGGERWGEEEMRTTGEGIDGGGGGGRKVGEGSGRRGRRSGVKGGRRGRRGAGVDGMGRK